MEPIRYLPTRDAARYLGLSPRTLEKHRCVGTGPTYHQIGGAVRYLLTDLDAWAERGRRRPAFADEAGAGALGVQG